MKRTGARLGATVLVAAVVTALAGLLAGSASDPALAVHPAAASTAASSGKPNVLFILVDDMRKDELAYMPNVQRLLADQGTTFDDAFSTFPLCCPARTSIMTGEYAHNHHVMGNDGAQHGGYYWFMKHSRPKDTIGTWLRKDGYQTSLVGKFLNSYGDTDPRAIPPGWDHWEVPPGLQAYDYTDQTWNLDGRLKRIPGHNSTSVQHLTMKSIAEAGTQPWFVWSGYLAPHDAWSTQRGWHQPEPMRADKHAGIVVPKIPNEPNMSDKPGFLRKRLPVLQPPRRAKIRRHSLLMAEVVHGVDRMIGKTVDKLEATGQLDNTLIIFASDNGFALGEHNIPSGKDLPYEEVTNVPLIMRGPGVPVGQHVDTLVTLQDITATITEATGARPKRTQDGVSLFDVIADPTAYANRAVLIESGGIMGSTRLLGSTSPNRRFFLGLRTRDHMYIRYVTGDHELYDLTKDPQEQRSMRDPALARKMQRGLNRLKNCQGSACNQPIHID